MTSTSTFTTDQFNRIIDDIVKGYHPEKIILFGSYLEGNFTRDSDLDLCIIKRSPEKRYRRAAAVKRTLTEYPVPMDVFVYTPEEFESTKDALNSLPYFISKYGRLIYEK